MRYVDDLSNPVWLEIHLRQFEVIVSLVNV